MRPLTLKEIEVFASMEGVKRIAVENFLISLPLEIGWANNLGNLDADAKSYRWNKATHNAIEAGIEMAYESDTNVARS